MGAINYGSNNYINLGVNVDCLRDVYGYEYEDFYTEIDFLYEEITTILDKYNFHYFHITIKSGYYEGFYIDIENNFSICFDDYTEKKEAQKEITQLKHFLNECANNGLVQYFPGWCTSYGDYASTKKAINEAIKTMREEVNSTPTWMQYNKGA